MLKSHTRNTLRVRLLAARDQFLIGMVDWTKPYYAKYFKSKCRPWSHTISSLKKLPANSLGRDLAQFLESNGLQLMPKLEDHDVLHVLLSYDTTVQDEARMQFFLLGNRKRSIYALVTALASLILIPEHLGSFFKAFSKGRRCRSIVSWKFEHLLAEPTLVLRQLIYRKDVGVEAPLVF